MNYDIIVEGFSFAYTNFDVLKSVNLSVKKGECLGLIGSNGSGKTTLINCILGELKGSGLIKVLDMEPDIRSLKYKSNLGVVLDNDLLLDFLTLNEYLFFIGRLYKVPDDELNDLISYWLEYFKLVEYRKRLIKYFSHGMRKKAQIIAAILHSPKVLIIDEPTNGLDVEMIYLLKSAISDLKKKGVTILISTHILNFIEELCDSVAIINNNTILKRIDLSTIDSTDNLEEIFMKIIK